MMTRKQATKQAAFLTKIHGEKWVVIKKGVPLTQENIAENVFTIANTEEEAKNWIADHVIGDHGDNA